MSLTHTPFRVPPHALPTATQLLKAFWPWSSCGFRHRYQWFEAMMQAGCEPLGGFHISTRGGEAGGGISSRFEIVELGQGI